MTKKLTLVVYFEAKPGKEQALKEVLTSLIAPTLKEEGCINYNLHQNLNNPALFMIYENWQNKEAHNKHGQTPHIQAWRQQRDGLLLKPNEASFWHE